MSSPHSDESITKVEAVTLDVTASKVAAQHESAQQAASSGSGSLWKWLAAVVAVIVVLGIGLGVGLGVGLKKDEDNGSSPLSATSGDSFDPSLPTYYIAADPVTWDFALDGVQCYDPAVMEPAWNATWKARITNVGGVFKKAMYRAYTDNTFTTVKERPAQDKYLGLLGPVIHVEAGSAFNVVFKNNLAFSVNMEPSGGLTWTNPAKGFLRAVSPGETSRVIWRVPESAAPQPRGPGFQNSRLYLYRSSVNPQSHDNAGLVGPIIVTAKGHANPDGTTKGIDRNIITLFQIYVEQASPYLFENGQDPKLQGTIFNKMAVNGHTWCNLPNLETNIGEDVRWHAASVGGAESTHNFHWHGNTLLHNGMRMDHINLMGGTTASLDLSNDAPGTWLFHCHVNSHLDQGMKSFYTVKGAQPAIVPFGGGIERTFYIAANEVLWNYAPLEGEACSGEVLPFGENAEVFLGPVDNSIMRIGSVYKKAMYFQYTDENFTTQVQRPADEQYLGILGPIMRANVGDVIKIVFLNNLTYPASMHPHGVIYDKSSEGSAYKDGSNQHGDDIVMPGSRWTYTWGVAERSGPGPADPSSMMWMYHSHVDETGDTSAGLIGALVVNRAAGERSTAQDAGLPDDVDQDAFLFFTVMAEASSTYAYDNVKTYLDPDLWNTTEKIEAMFADEGFIETSLKHMINGYMFCNMPRLAFPAGKRVRIHIMALGSQEDMHTPTIGGGSYLKLGGHSSSVVTLAGSMMSSDVMFTQPGNWTVACRVADHVMSGMEVSYEVTPAPQGPLALRGGTTRQYYIAADKVMWDYAPKGYQQCTSVNLAEDARSYITKGPLTIGSKRYKAQYRGYTNDNFTTLAPQPGPNYGIIGPVITAEVGDVVRVVFKNNMDFPVSLAPDGGLVAYHDLIKAKSIAPGETFVYEWVVPNEAGPLAGDLSTVTYTYLSDIDIPGHAAAGLVGLVIITAKDNLKPDGITPKDVDLVMPVLLQVFNENLSPLHEENIENAGFTPENLALLDGSIAFELKNLMHAINGYMYCNLPVIKIPLGAKVRLVMVAFGSEEGMHSPRVMGHVMTLQSGATQAPLLMPGFATAADMVTQNTGLWLVFCDIHDHILHGMLGQIEVVGSSRRMRMLQ